MESGVNMLFVPKGRTSSGNSRILFSANPTGTGLQTGTQVLGALNSYSAYTNMGVAERDSYGLSLNSSYTYSTSQSKRTSVIIGIDYSGGTSYVDYIGPFWVGNTYQLPDEHYYWPMFVPAGASLGIKVNTSYTSVNLGPMFTCHLHEASSNPESEKICTYWETLGITGQDWQGTNLSAGVNVQQLIGTTTRDLQYWDIGVNTTDINHNTIASGRLSLSVGDGVNYLEMAKMVWITDSSERLRLQKKPNRIEHFVPAGSNIYLSFPELPSSGGGISTLTAAVFGMI